MGFSTHAAVRMWYGYNDSLKLYINAHIETWIARGYKNNMKTYNVDINSLRPAWTLDPSFHQNHRAALFDKETKRKEPAWYVEMDDFVNAGSFTGYIWPI